MKQTHIIIMAVTTEVDVPNLHELIADRAWRIDGVCYAEAQLARTVPGDSGEWVVNMIDDVKSDINSADAPKV